jgi:DNA repair exonuclease SbcCD ATPase subunit
MRIFAIKMHNFMRFGEKNNSVIFDISKGQKEKISNGDLSFDDIYGDLLKSPIEYISNVKSDSFSNELEGLVGIVGKTSGSIDFSNGSGKSTIFEAISYLFYEKTVRQTANTDKKAAAGNYIVTRIDQLIPDWVNKSYVEGFFEERGSLYRLKRGRSFSKSKKSSSPILEFECIKDSEVDSLSGHRKKDTKKSLDQVILDDFDIFVNTVMFGQNDAGKFLIGTDKVKKDMIIDILKLEDVVHGCIDIIREKKKVSLEKLSSVESKIESLRKIIFDNAKDLINDEDEYKNFIDSEDKRKSFISYIKESDSRLENEKSIYVKDIEEFNKIVSDVKSDEVYKKVKLLSDEIKNLMKEKVQKDEDKKSRILEWESFIKNDEISISKINREIDSKNKEIEIIEKEKEETQKKVNPFDNNSIELEIKKCEKAKLVEEEYKLKKSAIEKEREEALKKVSEEETKKSILAKELSKIKEKINSIGDGESYTCSECKTVVKKDHALEKISKIEEDINFLDSRLNKVNGILKSIDEKKELIVSRIKKIDYYLNQEKILLSERKNHKILLGKIDQSSGFVKKYKDDIENKKIEKVNLEDKILKNKNKCSKIKEQADIEINDIDSKIAEKKEIGFSIKGKFSLAKSRLVEAKKKISEKQSEIDRVNKLQGALIEKGKSISEIFGEIDNKEKDKSKHRKDLLRYKILEDAFGLDGVQTRIVKKYLPLLNSYIGKFLDILSDGKLIVELLIDEKMKVGMKIIGGTANNYIMLSGGEKMIVRLAVDIGLSLLAFSRNEKKPDMICLDEIFGPLDTEHTKCVFKMLEELKDKFKKVFIISHKLEIQSAIENNLVVEKGSGNLGLSEIKSLESLI